MTPTISTRNQPSRSARPRLFELEHPRLEATPAPVELRDEADWAALQPSNWYGRWGKLLTTAVLFVLTAPLAAVLALPIALVNWALFGDVRKILYSQPRVGYRGKTFWIYKFRTMREARNDDFGSWREGADQARVTPFGRFLRCTHLDELAQFLNVARGEMAFIGPRPEMVEIDAWAQREIPEFSRRLAVKPGITGFSQITLGYTGVDVDAYRAKLAADERYLANFTLGFDLRILARTAVWMLRGRGWNWQAPAKPAAESEISSTRQVA